MSPLLNIGELISDPDFCQNFKVVRREGAWNKGRFTTVDSEFNTYGIIDPQSTEQMQFDSNGVLIKGLIKIYTHSDLYITCLNNKDNKSYNSDIVIWRGNQYIILDGENYKDYGYRGYTCQLKDAQSVN